MSPVRIMRALGLTLFLIASAGCQRKELLEPHDHHNLYIKASFDDHALDQLINIENEGWSSQGEPASTKYVLFEKTTQTMAYSGDFTGLEGGMYVQEGVYDLLVYTSDFYEYDANFYRNMSDKDSTETYTRQTPVEERAGSDVTEMYIVEPDPTFSVLQEEIIVYQGQEEQFVEVEFVQKSFRYYLTIKCTGLHNIHTAQMNISGMYTTAFLTNEEHRMDESGIQTVDLQIIQTKPTSAEELGKGELFGEFWSFGPNQREDIVNSITLYFINGDVTTMVLDDLTGKIKPLTRGGEIIVEQQIEIKGPPGGFDPGVGDWDDPTDVEIIL